MKDTDAAKKDHLYVLDQICVESTRNFIGMHYLAKWLYPDQFKDLDPEAVHKKYLTIGKFFDESSRNLQSSL
ncbi:MAG: hypothetical protein ACE14P_04565 [Methanotrichaceae archaeon]